ncbi:MAG: succinylglutamate desuccinylase/aspartoacylase family protein [Candidatus Uhrbacteria bacterium]|nr:succinylglutamate desuccinylase/aspartoacylase family protein [Candidatus Uhrbacteria bacterium]
MNDEDIRKENLEYFSQHVNTSLAFSMVLRGAQPGPHIVIVGGTHGTEPVGINASVVLHRYFTDHQEALLRGKITFILGNPQAYKENVRFIDENLNRAFHENTSDTVEGKRAQEIQSHLKHTIVTALLDLHSVSVGEFQMAAYVKGEKNERFALQISPLPLHFIFTERDLPGSLIGDASRYGSDALAVECGNHNSSHAINVALHHIHAVLQLFNMIQSDTFPSYAPIDKTSSPATIYETITPIKPHAGFHFFDSNVSTGTFAAKVAVFAIDDEMKHTAPQDCYIVMPDKNPKPGDFDAGFLCTKKEITQS